MFGKVDNYCSTEYSPDYTIYAKKVHQERGKERYADVPMVQVDNAWCYTNPCEKAQSTLPNHKRMGTSL